jgi:hypothetical protein
MFAAKEIRTNRGGCIPNVAFQPLASVTCTECDSEFRRDDK